MARIAVNDNGGLNRGKEFKWTKKEREGFETILWLFDDKNRQEGRSTVLAWVYVKLAMDGKKVNIIDHAYIIHSSRQVNKYLAEKIQKIILEDSLPLKVNMLDLTLERND